MKKQFMNAVICGSVLTVLLSGQAFSATSIKGLNESGTKELVFEGAEVNYDKHKMEGLDKILEGKVAREGLEEGTYPKEGLISKDTLEGNNLSFDRFGPRSGNFNGRTSSYGRVRYPKTYGQKNSWLTNRRGFETLEARRKEGLDIMHEGQEGKLEGLDRRFEGRGENFGEGEGIFVEGRPLMEGQEGKIEGLDRRFEGRGENFGEGEGIFVEGQEGKKEDLDIMHEGQEGKKEEKLYHEGRPLMEGQEFISKDLPSFDGKKEDKLLHEDIPSFEGKEEGKLNQEDLPILDGNQEGFFSSTEEMAAPASVISRSEAEAIALEYFGVKEEAIDAISTTVDAYSGWISYGIDFYSDGIGYYCDVDAATGEITAAGWYWM